MRAGIHQGQPFSVIAVQLADTPSTVYLLYPHARVEVDGSLICNADPSFAALPHRGEAIAFLAKNPIDADATLYYVRGDRIFYERGGVLVAAPGLALDRDIAAIRSIRELRERLRARRLERD